MPRHLLLALLLCVPAPASAAEPAGEIERLVKQLGSEDFKEREAASKALQKVGTPALNALRKAAWGEDAETRRRAGQLVRRIENGLDGLLAVYREYGLPLPPEGAELVRVVSGWVPEGPGRDSTPGYVLGFRLSPRGARARPRLLIGTEVYEPDPVWHKFEVVSPGVDLRAVHPRWQGRAFPLNAGLATAIQCQALGHRRLARELLAHSVEQGAGLSAWLFRRPDSRTPRAALVYLAWTHWANELARPGTDRAVIARQMKALLAAEPALDTEESRALLKSLEAALRPSRARPGSAEALIDRLVDLCMARQSWAVPEGDYWLLAERGFEAVPALLEHLDDERLTRTVREGYGIGRIDVPTRHLLVRDVVADILRDLACDGFGTNRVTRQQGEVVQKTAVRAWWEKARKQGEEGYLLAHVLPTGRHNNFPNGHVLRVIARKHPRRLPEVYRAVLEDHPEFQSWPVAEAVGKSALPGPEKIRLFLAATRHPNLEHRRAALRELKDLDADAFVERLVATLEALPAKPEGPYWMCREATFAGLTRQTADPRAWRALECAARRADVGLRMEILQGAAGEVAGPRRKERLAFLAAFLDDATLRVTLSDRQRYEGFPAGHGYPWLAVRDFAALQTAALLKLPEKPKPGWKPEEWAALRAKVRHALQQEQVRAGWRRAAPG